MKGGLRQEVEELPKATPDAPERVRISITSSVGKGFEHTYVLGGPPVSTKMQTRAFTDTLVRTAEGSLKMDKVDDTAGVKIVVVRSVNAEGMLEMKQTALPEPDIATPLSKPVSTVQLFRRVAADDKAAEKPAAKGFFSAWFAPKEAAPPGKKKEKKKKPGKEAPPPVVVRFSPDKPMGMGFKAGTLTVAKVADGSQSAALGVLPKWAVTLVNGEACGSEEALKQFVVLAKGEDGGKLEITFQPPSGKVKKAKTAAPAATGGEPEAKAEKKKKKSGKKAKADVGGPEPKTAKPVKKKKKKKKGGGA